MGKQIQLVIRSEMEQQQANNGAVTPQGGNESLLKNKRVFRICVIYLLLVHLVLAFFTTVVMMNWLCFSPPDDLTIAEEEESADSLRCYSNTPFAAALAISVSLGLLWLLPCLAFVFSGHLACQKHSRPQQATTSPPTSVVTVQS